MSPDPLQQIAEYLERIASALETQNALALSSTQMAADVFGKMGFSNDDE